MLWCASLCGLFIGKRPNTQPGNITWNFYRQRLISSFHRVLPNLVSLQVVNRTFANMAMSSFSEKYISPRGFDQMKKRSCPMSNIQTVQTDDLNIKNVHNLKPSRIQDPKIKALDNESNVSLKCLECFQDPRSKIKGSRH